MSLCFKLPKNEDMIFPEECFVCGSKSTDFYSMRRFSILSAILAYRNINMTIVVPVCRKHSTLLKFCRNGFRGLLILAISLLATGYTMLAVICVFIAMSLFMLSFKSTRRFFIFDLDKHDITFSSHDDDYIRKLGSLNNTTIFEKSYLI